MKRLQKKRRLVSAVSSLNFNIECASQASLEGLSMTLAMSQIITNDGCRRRHHHRRRRGYRVELVVLLRSLSLLGLPNLDRSIL